MPTITRTMRKYANDVEIARFSKWLFEQGYRQGQAKAFLEPRSYQVRGTNFGYRDVDACLALMELIFEPQVEAPASKPKAKSTRRTSSARRICDM